MKKQLAIIMIMCLSLIGNISAQEKHNLGDHEISIFTFESITHSDMDIHSKYPSFVFYDTVREESNLYFGTDFKDQEAMNQLSHDLKKDKALVGKNFKIVLVFESTYIYEYMGPNKPRKKSSKPIEKWMVESITKM